MSLPLLRARLADVHDSILSFSVPLPQPPVISHTRDSVEALPGLRLLREEIRRDCDVLRRFPGGHASPSPSTNAPYLIAVWDELVRARHPVAIYRTFSPVNRRGKTRGKGATPAPKGQARAVKVDVVAENGARWVRVNTIKNARLMTEFREVDSYLTSDDDEDQPRPRVAQTEFDNSVLRMGRELLAAAKANPISAPTPFLGLVVDSDSTSDLNTFTTPQVTIRLTRLDPSTKDDPRIEKTIQCLRDMGIDVQLGERSSPIPKTPAKYRALEPSTDINLDLSALIALISDISYSSLPRTEQEAYTRFEPPQTYLDWKRERVKSLARQSHGAHGSLYNVEDDENNDDIWENSGQHSRALAIQTIQEMNNGLLKEMHERISAAATQPSTLSTSVTFWTTSEARRRCLQIVSKIGGKVERQRADALLCSTCCSRLPPVPVPAQIYANGDGVARTDEMLGKTSSMGDTEGRALAGAYWEHSRYPSGFLPLVSVRVYSSILPAVETEAPQSKANFFDALTRTCTGILSHNAALVSQLSALSDDSTTDAGVLEEIMPPMQTCIPKLTVHTVTSMLAGASRGYTTLTTNRSSVKAMLKEMQRIRGRSGYEAEMGDIEKAAMWVVDPRSLSEGIRSE